MLPCSDIRAEIVALSTKDAVSIYQSTFNKHSCESLGTKRLPVINLCKICCFKCKLNFTDDERSVYYNKLNICEVRIRIREVGCFELHIVGSGIRTLYCRISAECEVGFRVKRIADAYCIACYSLLGSVVCFGTTVLSNGYRHLFSNSCNCKSSFCSSDFVVGCKCSIIQ